MKTLLFVDDEPMVLQGLQRQLRPMRSEWDMHFVDGGQKALDFMAAHPVDIVVSDMMMPGMDGAQLLTEIVKRHPQSVRIILSGHAEREAVLRLVGPAHQYLSKPCDAEELRKAIARAFALRDLLGNDRLKQLATRIKTLPTLPALQNQLTAELQKESPSIERVGEIISRDIGMTAKILQLVELGVFRPRPAGQQPDGGRHLSGLEHDSFPGAVDGASFRSTTRKPARRFPSKRWRNIPGPPASWPAASRAAERQEAKILDQCFLAGLLHDVGQLVLAFGLPDEYAEVIARAQAENSFRSGRPNRNLLAPRTADVGAYLLALWGLPNPIIEAVALHHQPARCAAPEFSPAIAVHAAEVFAHELAGTQSETPPPQLDLPYLTRAGFGRKN